MTNITITTEKKKQMVDITDDVNQYVQRAGVAAGLCHVFAKHTTAAVTTADLDGGTDQDMLDAFERIVPKLKYRHPHDPSHVGDHIMASIIGPGVMVPISGGALDLGVWQRVVFVELDGPREREVVVSFL